MARKFKFYGFLHYSPCVADYPAPESQVLVSSGDREFNIRMEQENVSFYFISMLKKARKVRNNKLCFQKIIKNFLYDCYR